MDLEENKFIEYVICRFCNKQKNKKHIALSGKSEGMCKECYRKYLWKQKLVKCPRCERMLPMHAKGLCAGCYNSTYYLDIVKLHNANLALLSAEIN